MAHLPTDEDSRSRDLRLFVVAGTVIFVITMTAIVVILIENKADALSRLVIALAPTIASAVGIVTTAVLNGRIRDDQHDVKGRLNAVSQQVSTVEHQTNGALSPRLKNVVTEVLQDPAIQDQVAGKLADNLIKRAGNPGDHPNAGRRATDGALPLSPPGPSQTPDSPGQKGPDSPEHS